MIITTDAIVLRTIKYRDTSRIATLFTKEFGKVSVIAKGERARAAKFGGSLNVFACVTAVLYWKEQRDLQFLSRCDLQKPFHRIGEDMERMAGAMMALELLDAVTHAEEKNPPLFALILDTLDALDQTPRNVSSILFFYQLHLLTILGFHPSFNHCCRCERSFAGDEAGNQTYLLNASLGGAYCADCSVEQQGTEYLCAGSLRTLQHFQTLKSPLEAASLSVAPQVRGEVSLALRQLLVSHVEGIRPLKSETVFASMATQP